jgi:DNA-binding CsgD family transcriptional regulator
LIRIAIIADTLGRARQLATMLADDERLEIVDVRASNGRFVNPSVDVIVAVALSPANLMAYRARIVLVSDAGPHFAENIRAFLPLSVSAAQISAAIEAAANDLTVFTQEQALRWIPFSQNRVEDDAGAEELTGRELQVLRMIADGSGNKEIAVALGISEHTVKFHVAQILAKLNAASRTEAVSLGIRRGLIPI